MSDRPVRLLSQADIAGWFGVDAPTVAQWRKRFPPDSYHPFPIADFETGTERPTPGWLPEREPEIREWHADRPGRWPVGGRPAGSRLGSQTLRDP